MYVDAAFSLMPIDVFLWGAVIGFIAGTAESFGKIRWCLPTNLHSIIEVFTATLEPTSSIGYISCCFREWTYSIFSLYSLSFLCARNISQSEWHTLTLLESEARTISQNASTHTHGKWSAFSEDADDEDLSSFLRDEPVSHRYRRVGRPLPVPPSYPPPSADRRQAEKAHISLYELLGFQNFDNGLLSGGQCADLGLLNFNASATKEFSFPWTALNKSATWDLRLCVLEAQSHASAEKISQFNGKIAKITDSLAPAISRSFSTLEAELLDKQSDKCSSMVTEQCKAVWQNCNTLCLKQTELLTSNFSEQVSSLMQQLFSLLEQMTSASESSIAKIDKRLQALEGVNEYAELSLHDELTNPQCMLEVKCSIYSVQYLQIYSTLVWRSTATAEETLARLLEL